MKIIGWVRHGDKAACGGTVAEASESDLSHGKALAYQGAAMSCAGNCVISDGYPGSVLANGKAQVLDGQLTSGGCALASTLNGIDGVCG